MTVLYGGKPFSGITYNQGAFSGDKGHLFIKGIQQCSYALNRKSKNRVWFPIKGIAELERNINGNENLCSACRTEILAKIERITSQKEGVK